MSTVAEIEAAIQKLSTTKLSDLLAWIEEYRAAVGASQSLFDLYDEEKRGHVEGYSRFLT